MSKLKFTWPAWASTAKQMPSNSTSARTCPETGKIDLLQDGDSIEIDAEETAIRT